MNALTLQLREVFPRFAAMVVPKLRTLHQHFLRGLDALAEARMRRAQFEIDRGRRLMQPDRRSPVDAPRVGR
jgi:hypothetical protein